MKNVVLYYSTADIMFCKMTEHILTDIYYHVLLLNLTRPRYGSGIRGFSLQTNAQISIKNEKIKI